MCAPPGVKQLGSAHRRLPRPPFLPSFALCAVKEAAAADIPRGTRITLHLKPDALEFAETSRLQVPRAAGLPAVCCCSGGPCRRSVLAGPPIDSLPPHLPSLPVLPVYRPAVPHQAVLGVHRLPHQAVGQELHARAGAPAQAAVLSRCCSACAAPAAVLACPPRRAHSPECSLRRLRPRVSSPVQVVDEEATAKAQEEADAKAKEEGKEAADKVAPGAARWLQQAAAGCSRLPPASQPARRRADAMRALGVVRACHRSRPHTLARPHTHSRSPTLHLLPSLSAAVMKTDWKESEAWAVQNDNKPLWVRSPKEVTKDEYDAFFKATFRQALLVLDSNSSLGSPASIGEVCALIWRPRHHPLTRRSPTLPLTLALSASAAGSLWSRWASPTSMLRAPSRRVD